MKKSIILMAGLIGFALTSCEDTSDLGVMQKNEAPIVVPADGVAIQNRFDQNGVNDINLQNYEGLEIPVINISLSTDFPEGSTVTGQMQIATTEDFSDATTVNLEALPSNEILLTASALTKASDSLIGYVMCQDWEDAFVSFYGYNPATEVNYVRFRLYLNEGTQNNLLYYSDGSEWWPALKFNVTPLDANLDVAPAYTFFYTVGGQTTSVDMYHNPDNHVYDDPVFNSYVEVPEGEALEWWITPTDQTDLRYGVLGEDPAVEKGSLGLIEEGAIMGQIDVPGTYKIEADMLGKTFDVKIAPPSLYVMSYSGITFAQAAQLGTEDNVVYSGMAGLLQKWGLTGQVGYKPTLYVNDPNFDRTQSGGTYKGGLLFDTSGAPLNADSGIPYPGSGAGLYYITANLQSMTYTGYQCKTLGFVGSPNGWGDDFATLKGSRTTFYMEWSGEITVSEGDEWKIRANGEWAVNFGGADGGNYTTDGTQFNLSMDGANLVAPADGTYVVTVYLRRALDEDGNLSPYYMTVTPKE